MCYQQRHSVYKSKYSVTNSNKNHLGFEHELTSEGKQTTPCSDINYCIEILNATTGSVARKGDRANASVSCRKGTRNTNTASGRKVNRNTAIIGDKNKNRNTGSDDARKGKSNTGIDGGKKSNRKTGNAAGQYGHALSSTLDADKRRHY